MPFKKGESGNSKGRPRNTGKQFEMRAMLDSHVPDILEALITLAKGGDLTASKLILDRCLAPLKQIAPPASQTIELKGETLANKGESLLSLIAGGNITIEDSTKLMSVLSSQAKLVEIGELTSRLEALESKQ